MSAVIGALASAVGAPTLLTDLPERAMPAGVAKELMDRGQRMCPVTADELPLVEESVSRSLAAAAVDAGSVDHVLVATETMAVSGSRAAHERMRGRLHRTLSGLGLGHAPVTALTFGGCSAVMTALEYAALRVERDPGSRVLVVAVGRMREDDSRVLAPAVSAIGDGVASCVVRAEGEGWRVHWMLRRAFLQTAEFDQDADFGPALVILGRALRLLRGEAEKRGLPDRPRLVCNNYGLPTVRLFSSTLGVPADDVFTDNIPLLSHLGTPDVLINLASLAETTTEVLALATGPADCVLASLERTRSDPV